MMGVTNILTTAFINIRGQTGLHLSKQLQIENFIRENRIDILHLQESHIEENTFSECNLIASGYNIVQPQSAISDVSIESKLPWFLKEVSVQP